MAAGFGCRQVGVSTLLDPEFLEAHVDFDKGGVVVCLADHCRLYLPENVAQQHGRGVESMNGGTT